MKPTLEEVKAYFKNAKEVRCLNRKKDIGTPDFEKMYFTENGVVIQNPWDKNWLVLYDHKKGYAEIISYKDEPLTVSKEFILEAYNDACSTWKRKLEEQFPSVFESKLEVGRWYKGYNSIVFIDKEAKDNTKIGFGITGSGDWTDKWHYYNNLDLKPATHEEVETALINEAKKRGLYGNISIITPYDGTERKLKDNGAKFNYFENEKECYLTYYGWRVFENGKWATIIEQPTEMTVAEIEQKLGCKIKIVG